MQAENIIRTANAWLLIFKWFCIFFATASYFSHCHQYCHRCRIHPCTVPERAPTDVGAILHVQHFAYDHSGMAVPSSATPEIQCC